MFYSYVAQGLFALIALASAQSGATTPERLLQQDLNLNQEQLGRVVELALKHLDAITKDASGQPNPRLTCTAGYDDAAQYVSSVMQNMSLVPLGDNSTFFQSLPGSVDAEYCPTGMKNLAGMIQGTDESTTEKIMFSAHLDGPNNQGPNQREDGNQDTVNAYDDGFAVVLSLAIAEVIIEENLQPKRSVVFLFGDGEEGWENVGIPARGETKVVSVCPPNAIVETSWYKDLIELLPSEPGSCGQYSLGATYWVKNPTVDLSTIKAAFYADPLGSSYAKETPLAVIGGEASTLGSSNTNMNSYVAGLIDGLPQKLPLVFIARKGIEGNYASIDVVAKDYGMLCDSSESCLKDRGIPSVWIAQPDFQKYHGGLNYYEAAAAFGSIFKGPAKYPSTLYMGLDTMKNFDATQLLPVASTISGLILNAANSELTSQLQFNVTNYDVSTEEMVNSALASIDVSEKYMNDLLPAEAKPAFQKMLQYLRDGFSQSDATQEFFQLSKLLAGVFIGCDFFSVDYPDKEAYLDYQTFESGFGTIPLPAVVISTEGGSAATGGEATGHPTEGGSAATGGEATTDTTAPSSAPSFKPSVFESDNPTSSCAHPVSTGSCMILALLLVVAAV